MGAARREQTGDGTFLAFANNGRYGPSQQFLVRLHVATHPRGLVKALARLGIRQVAADAELLQPVQHLLCLRVGQEHLFVVADMNDEMRAERIARFRRFIGAFTDSPQTENRAGPDGGVRPRTGIWRGRGDGVGAERQSIEPILVVAQVSRQVDAEVVQRQISDGNATGQVFQVDHRVLQLLQLRTAIFEIVHLVASLELDNVLLASGRDVEQDHAAADAGLKVKVFIQLHIGPEVDQLDLGVGRSDPVDPAKPLDDAHRVPMDVVVDQEVAVLQVLTFGNAVCGDQEVDLSLFRKLDGALLRPGRKRAEDCAHIRPQVSDGGLVGSGAAHDGSIDAQRRLRPRRKFPV